MSDSLRQHSLAATWRPIHQHTSRRVNPNLLVQLKVGQRQLNGLPDLLLLHVHPSDIAVLNVRLLIGLKHANGRVGLWREDIDEGVAVLVEGDARRGLQELAVDGREDTDVIVRASRGAYDACVLIDRL